MSDPRPASPRSPRPDPSLPEPPPSLPPGALVGLAAPPPPPRPSLSSMLFLTAFFFFMSGGNNMPDQQIVVGPDGEIQPRVTELDMARTYVEEYTGWMNGTGNWTEPVEPVLQPSSLIPPEYDHQPQEFFTNITGFYREATLHPINLLSPPLDSQFFHDLHIPNLNTSSWNETRANEMRGELEWAGMNKWSMNLRERDLTGNFTDWTWVKGGATLSSENNEVEYSFYGLHYLPNGTYNLFAQPDGIRIDIRNIPRLYSDPDHHNLTSQIILAELQKELELERNNLLLSDVQPDDPTETRCPLLVYLTVPPLPPGVTRESIAIYENELRRPSGIAWSLDRPPGYWEGLGLGGVVVADECGWAFGIEGGTGLKIDDFWRKSVNSTASQLLVLVLLVRQMESTRTPSTLAKVSLGTVTIMFVADSWIFSAHAVIGIMSDNKTSLPLLVPAFLFLCSAVVFGPAPERVVMPPTPRPRPNASLLPTSTEEAGSPPTIGTDVPEEPEPSLMQHIRDTFKAHPFLKWVIATVVFFGLFQLAVLPSLVPFFLFSMYSFWLPQIWRNARRGTSHALDHSFVIGTSVGRLVLPLYAFACPDNVFFLNKQDWIWGLVAWQWAQIVMLFAQERFGPSFFLPKSLAPSESYNYHPLLPPTDPENPTPSAEETCSICMEAVDTRPGPSGEVLLGINPRRAYALAPCHHLFHTKCLAQWMAVKTICPLCKRSLPPL